MVPNWIESSANTLFSHIDNRSINCTHGRTAVFSESRCGILQRIYGSFWRFWTPFGNKGTSLVLPLSFLCSYFSWKMSVFHVCPGHNFTFPILLFPDFCHYKTQTFLQNSTFMQISKHFIITLWLRFLMM